MGIGSLPQELEGNPEAPLRFGGEDLSLTALCGALYLRGKNYNRAT